MGETMASPRRRLPLWLKVAFTLFVCVQVTFYWKNYGPSNFLYFCDFALFLTLAALWTEHPLLASIPAVGILAPQALWVTDFVAGALGHPLTGMTNYMFDGEHNSIESRAISLFHGWLPFLLGWLVYRLGYDRRAPVAWPAIAWALCILCYNCFPAPGEVSDPNIPVNINYVFGPDDQAAQTWMPSRTYLAVYMLGLFLVFFLPRARPAATVRALKRPRRPSRRPPEAGSAGSIRERRGASTSRSRARRRRDRQG